MTKPNDDVQVHAVNTTPGVNVICITPGPNAKTDTLALGGDDRYDGESVTAGPNGIVETTANSSGNNFYPSDAGTKADVESTLRTAYASSTANHAAYLDFEVSEGTLNLPYRAEINAPSTDTDWARYLDTNLHAAGAQHASYTYDLIGTAAIRDAYATARQKPHVGLSLTTILRVYGRGRQGPNYNVVHELGHALTKYTINTHVDHTDGDTQRNCALEVSFLGGSGLRICERHVALLRRNATKTWDNHLSQTDSNESARDSDSADAAG
jgi:hypothetical protein